MELEKGVREAFENHGFVVESREPQKFFTHITFVLREKSGNGIKHCVSFSRCDAEKCDVYWTSRVRGHSHARERFTVHSPWLLELTGVIVENACMVWRLDNELQRFARRCYKTASAGIELDPNDSIEHADRLPGFAHELEALLVRYGYTSSQDVFKVRAREERA